MNVIELLQKAVVDQASDIFIIAGLPCILPGPTAGF